MRIIKKRIIFGITSLTIGGAERVLVDLANELSEKYEIKIFTIYDKGELMKELNPSIELQSLYHCRYDQLNKLYKILIPLKLLFKYKSIYKKYIGSNYDVEIAFLEGPITRLFSVKNSISKKIAWVHNDIKYVFGEGFKSKIKRLIDYKAYKNYNNIIFVSKENMNSFKDQYKAIDRSKMSVIYNYIDSRVVKRKATQYSTELVKCNNPKFVTVCRLVNQKGIDRLIRVHKKIIDKGLIHEFFVIGDGPERKKLDQIIRDNKVEETFHMIGKKENPYPYIREADYFCLLSYFEGYGMVLEEAKILSKNIIITDTAAKEAVVGYAKAVVVDNNELDIYNGLVDLISGKISFKKENYEYDNRKNIDRIIEIIEK